VRPLYSEASGVAGKLASIEFSEADNRVEQEVRNRLIFLASRGAGEPDKAGLQGRSERPIERNRYTPGGLFRRIARWSRDRQRRFHAEVEQGWPCDPVRAINRPWRWSIFRNRSLPSSAPFATLRIALPVRPRIVAADIAAALGR
jgi:hypothetical protein